jgi:hypothetical protein
MGDDIIMMARETMMMGISSISFVVESKASYLFVNFS